MRHSGRLAQTVYAVGVDSGGTWIRFKGLNARGRCVWSLTKSSPSVERLPAFLKSNLKRFHGKLPLLAVGSRGVWKQAKRRQLTNALRGLARKIVVMSDVEAAWLSAFKSEGIIVISGTGSIAYGRTSDGKSARAGGLGPEKGDEGSGYWIGKKWLEGRGVRGEERQSVREIAKLAPLVIQKSKAGNARASFIIQQAQYHLVQLVQDLIRKLHLKGKIPLSVSGSVLENESFWTGFFKTLRRRGIAFRYVRKAIDPAIASLSLRHSPL